MGNKKNIDDLANHWGTTLIPTPRLNNDPNDQSALADFQLVVSNMLDNSYHLIKITSCGSEANMHAIMDQSEGVTDGMLIACGSYVAGDAAILQSWSTSQYAVEDGIAFINSPNAVKPNFTKKHTVPLPYHIPGVVDDQFLSEYEDQCLLNLHQRCLVGKMMDEPVTGLLMELILAGNGATLSDRALTKIGELAAFHKFGIIVDEIMTGGRSGNMLLTEKKPKVFSNEVTHITMGKWMMVGMVLCSGKAYQRYLVRVSNLPTRGVSTYLACRQCLLTWKTVHDKLPKTKERRSLVMKALQKRCKVSEEETWGEGILIFAPIWRRDPRPGDALKATRNRLLPMLVGGDIGTLSLDTNAGRVWNKKSVNDKVMEGVNDWLQFNWTTSLRENQSMILAKSFAHMKPGDFRTSQSYKDCEFRGREHQAHAVLAVVHTAVKCRLMQTSFYTRRRLRCWRVMRGAIPPWVPSEEENEKTINNRVEYTKGSRRSKRLREDLDEDAESGSELSG